ncbi:hypothetical protein AB205_0000360, partial [Aquarana catesbeiana]
VQAGRTAVDVISGGAADVFLLTCDFWFWVAGLIGGLAEAGDESIHSTGSERTLQAAPPECQKPMLRQCSAMPAPAIPRATLGEAWKKVLCKGCIDALVNERASEQETGLAASVKELSSTFQSFKTLFEGLQLPATPSPASQSTTPPLAQGFASSQPRATASAEETAGPSREEAREEPDSATSSSQDESEGENWDGESRRPSRYKLSLDEVEDILGAVYTTLGIQVDKKPLSLHDHMYKGLGEQKSVPSPQGPGGDGQKGMAGSRAETLLLQIPENISLFG